MLNSRIGYRLCIYSLLNANYQVPPSTTTTTTTDHRLLAPTLTSTLTLAATAAATQSESCLAVMNGGTGDGIVNATWQE